MAAEGCLDGRFSGMVTAPLSKSVVAESGISFTGHTEFIAAITNAALPVMMLH
jgi:4-hydroxythreonine-4-phosphate dehydrogenase